MSDASGDLVLQYDLKEGRNADAQAAAESLLAWIDLARDAARAIDPYSDIRVELLAREEGSLKQLLRLVDDHIATISEGANEFPYLKKTAIGLAIAIATSGLQIAIEKTFEDPVQNVALSPADRELLQGMTQAIRESAEASKSAMRFFRAIERDPAVTDVKVRTSEDSTPLVVVDRAEFALRGGLFVPEAAPQPDETKRAVWSVVLLTAPFYASSRHWRFSRDGTPVSAQMADLAFLQAIVDGTVPISLHEGVRMEVEVEWKERMVGRVPITVPDSRKIVRVISPRPGEPLPPPDGPEEYNQGSEDAYRDDQRGLAGQTGEAEEADDRRGQDH